jgi:drug/metabolite transporter (DMT)-like permease
MGREMSEQTAARDWKALAAALVSVCLWSSAFVGIRATTNSLAPGALALGRLLIGSVLLGALLMSRGPLRPTRRELGLLALAGLLWFGLYNVALNTAEHVVDAGTAAMVVNIAPLMIMALAAVFLRERLTPNLLVGGAVAFVGVILIGLATTSGKAPVWGILLCVIATTSSAAGVVAQKPVLARLSPLQVTWICCTIGALCCLPYAPALVRDVRTAPATALAWMAYLGVFPTSVAFTTWAFALSRGAASRLATVAYLVPPVTIVMSWLILGEIPRVVAIIGGVLCLVGVVFARRTPRRNASSPTR